MLRLAVWGVADGLNGAQEVSLPSRQVGAAGKAMFPCSLGIQEKAHHREKLVYRLAACGEMAFSGVTELVSEIAMISRPSES